MSLMRDHRRRGDLLAKDITTGPDWHRDGEQWQGFLSVFEGAVFRCAVERIKVEGGDIDTCLEIELREVRRVVKFVVLSACTCACVCVVVPSMLGAGLHLCAHQSGSHRRKANTQEFI